MYKYIILSLAVSVIPIQIFAAENTDLLDTEPTVSAPKFSYETFGSCSEFENTMKKILPKDTYYGRA